MQLLTKFYVKIGSILTKALCCRRTECKLYSDWSIIIVIRFSHFYILAEIFNMLLEINSNV